MKHKIAIVVAIIGAVGTIIAAVMQDNSNFTLINVNGSNNTVNEGK